MEHEDKIRTCALSELLDRTYSWPLMTSESGMSNASTQIWLAHSFPPGTWALIWQAARGQGWCAYCSQWGRGVFSGKKGGIKGLVWKNAWAALSAPDCHKWSLSSWQSRFLLLLGTVNLWGSSPPHLLYWHPPQSWGFSVHSIHLCAEYICGTVADHPAECRGQRDMNKVEPCSWCPCHEEIPFPPALCMAGSFSSFRSLTDCAPHYKFIVEVPVPNVIVLGGGDFQEVTDEVKGWDPYNGISAITRDQRACLVSNTWGYKKKAASQKAHQNPTEALSRTWPGWHPDLQLPSFQSCEK